jgi:hypothetical protein
MPPLAEYRLRRIEPFADAVSGDRMGNPAHPLQVHLPRDFPGRGIFFTPDSGPGPFPFGPLTGFKVGMCGPLATPLDPAKAGGSLVIFGI